MLSICGFCGVRIPILNENRLIDSFGSPESFVCPYYSFASFLFFPSLWYHGTIWVILLNNVSKNKTAVTPVRSIWSIVCEHLWIYWKENGTIIGLFMCALWKFVSVVKSWSSYININVGYTFSMSNHINLIILDTKLKWITQQKFFFWILIHWLVFSFGTTLYHDHWSVITCRDWLCVLTQELVSTEMKSSKIASFSCLLINLYLFSIDVLLLWTPLLIDLMLLM